MLRIGTNVKTYSGPVQGHLWAINWQKIWCISSNNVVNNVQFLVLSIQFNLCCLRVLLVGGKE